METNCTENRCAAVQHIFSETIGPVHLQGEQRMW